MIAQAIDADGDGTVDINEFKHYFQRDSASQQDEPDDVQVKFIEDDPSPPGIQLQVSQQLGAFSGLASCLDGGEYPHSPETHPFVRSNTVFADQTESKSRTAMMKKMSNTSFYSVSRGVFRASVRARACSHFLSIVIARAPPPPSAANGAGRSRRGVRFDKACRGSRARAAAQRVRPER